MAALESASFIVGKMKGDIVDAILTISTLAFIAIACSGVVGHAVVKWMRGELAVSVFDYFFRVNTRASALMFCTAVGTVLTSALTGTLTNFHEGSQVMAAWLIGYAADSAFNRQQESK